MENIALGDAALLAMEYETKLLRLCYDALSKGVTTIPIAAVDVIFGWSSDNGMGEMERY